MIEAHFGVPMTGAVLVPLNTRLDAAGIAFILEHSEAKVLLVDRAFAALAAAALAPLDRPPVVVDVDDPEYTGPGERIGAQDYESLLASGDPGYRAQRTRRRVAGHLPELHLGHHGQPEGRRRTTTAAPTSTRSATSSTWDMPRHSVYLWTLPMFHCNGWCFPWTMAADAGTNVCLRKVDAATIYRLDRASTGVTHYCGAPVVHNLLLDAPAELRRARPRAPGADRGRAAAGPRPSRALERLGIDLTHVYGLTETYGPATVCAKHAAWADLRRRGARARRNGAAGRALPARGRHDGDRPRRRAARCRRTARPIGEIVFRGNITMMGYFKNPPATEQAFAGGWFHSGDLAVLHPDGYMKIKDRAKDVIISGGENISSVEVEDALYRHPAGRLRAAVVAQPDEKWGETPCAYVELQPGATATRGRADRALPAAARRASRCRAPWSSPRSRRPRPGRSRSMSCASVPAPRRRSSRDRYGSSRDRVRIEQGANTVEQESRREHDMTETTTSGTRQRAGRGPRSSGGRPPAGSSGSPSPAATATTRCPAR